MTARPSLLLALALTACASAPPPREEPPPAPPADATPAIVMRGEPAPARPAPAPTTPEVDPALIEALRRDASRPDAPAPAERPAPRTGELPVVLGEAQGFGVRVAARADGEGRFAASVELVNRTAHAWATVEVALDLLDGRRPLERTTVRLERLERRGTATAQLEGALPAGVDRVRATVVAAEPQPGEADVAWRAGRLRGFDVRTARLLRTRAHELDAILELGGGPLQHVPWSGANVEVVFLDDRGQTITTGRAHLLRGGGAPWRLHVVGEQPSRRQVALIEVRVPDLRFD